VKVPSELISFLKTEDHFFIATHINPEADALGSSLALADALEDMKKQVVLFVRDPVPDFYRFLPNHEKFMHSASQVQPSDYNLLLLDCNTLDRAGIEGLNFRKSLVIDHHETGKDFGDIKWVEPSAAATGMMIFSVLKGLGIRITKEIAINLYSAIAIDTGTFRYSNTTAEVLNVSAELIQSGASPSLISQNLYEMWSEKRFRLLILALNTLEIRNNIAFIAVTRDMFKETGTDAEDTENFPGFPRMIGDITLAVFFREISDDYWKVSLRSKGKLNVADIAESFGGGGHKNAAGFRIRGPLDSLKELIIKKVY
jgi:phosphoesterase RecJ-like protein